MKIRLGFVSNSSSSSFCAICDLTVDGATFEVGQDEDGYGDGRAVMKELKNLIENSELKDRIKIGEIY